LAGPSGNVRTTDTARASTEALASGPPEAARHVHCWRAPAVQSPASLPKSTTARRTPRQGPTPGAPRAIAAAGGPSCHHARNGGQSRAGILQALASAHAAAVPLQSRQRTGFACAPAHPEGLLLDHTATAQHTLCRTQAGATLPPDDN